LARSDRKRKKKGCNKEWNHSHDPDVRITMMDGRTHLARKAEHVLDLPGGAVMAITVQPASDGDTSTMGGTLKEAQAIAEIIAERASKRWWPTRPPSRRRRAEQDETAGTRVTNRGTTAATTPKAAQAAKNGVEEHKQSQTLCSCPTVIGHALCVFRRQAGPVRPCQTPTPRSRMLRDASTAPRGRCGKKRLVANSEGPPEASGHVIRPMTACRMRVWTILT
jgi:hypothetical protein